MAWADGTCVVEGSCDSRWALLAGPRPAAGRTIERHPCAISGMNAYNVLYRFAVVLIESTAELCSTQSPAPPRPLGSTELWRFLLVVSTSISSHSPGGLSLYFGGDRTVLPQWTRHVLWLRYLDCYEQALLSHCEPALDHIARSRGERTRAVTGSVHSGSHRPSVGRQNGSSSRITMTNDVYAIGITP